MSGALDTLAGEQLLRNPEAWILVGGAATKHFQVQRLVEVQTQL